VPLTPGVRLGSYQVTAPLGEGGMGEVYRATDTTLGRSVAIKVLPDSVAVDPERLARFEREARTLASLNHPNIAQVYGFENANGIRALVMELVDGPTLADRIAQGPVPIDEALAIARQIATALECAHEAGIVHRDLKPANVKVRPDGTVKVLDFGLAKAVEPTGASSTDLSPTITSPALVTGAGVLLGTAGYMSPEQARGKAVDKRADIWAFGAVLYEMLTGDRLWAGETNLDVLAQVVHKEPDLQRIPAHLRRLLSRCLEKDPKKRLRDISGVELLLEEPVALATARSSLALTGAIAAGLLAVALAAVTWTLWPKPAIERTVSRFSIEAPAGSDFTYAFPGAAVSRDGRLLVFTAARIGSPSMLWLRPIDSLDARELKGTEQTNFPFWSPDAKSIAFLSISDRSLKRLDVLGGTPQKLCDAPEFEGGDWSRQGLILFSASGVIQKVETSDGSCTPVTTLNPGSGERHTFPHVLPDGRKFLFLVRSSDKNVEGVYVSSLDDPGRRTKLLNTDTKALYAPPHGGRPGFLLWLRGRTLVAQRFDPDSATLDGDLVSLAEGIRVGGGQNFGRSANRAAFWVSENGLLIYRTGTNDGRSLIWIGRDAKPLETVLEEEREGERVQTPRLSRDGSRLVVERVVSDVSDIWVYTMARRVWSKLTSTPEREMSPDWSHDGRQVVYGAERDGTTQIYRLDANGGGQEERLTDGPNPKLMVDWSQDGRYLMYSELRNGQRDLFILPFDAPNGRPGKPIPFLTTAANESQGKFSPDGKWIAYLSDKTGVNEAYIRTFPGGPAGEWPVSSGGAAALAWTANGELFYRLPNPGGRVNVTSTPIRLLADRPEIGAPQPVLTNAAVTDTSVMSSDGRRFLVFTRPGVETTGSEGIPLTVVLNWQAGLK
jgi:eukaryotic-like serine/threonine-protein kinase